MGRWMGCICILTIVAARGGMTPLAVGVSSIYCRTVEERLSLGWALAGLLPDVGGVLMSSIVVVATRAARNTRHVLVGCLASLVGGKPDERGEQDPRAGRGRVDAPTCRGGDRAAVRRRGVLPGRRQGAGQVRDAARAPGGRRQRDRRRGPAWLLAGRVLPGASRLRPGRDDRAARRQAGPSGSGQAHRGDHRVPACRPGVGVRGGAGRGGGRPVRGPSAPTHGATGPPAVTAAASASPGRFWPVGEAAQADYEALRRQVLAP